ncbi:Uncharacterised protein [Vibrio cholerae]|nr:Uncharacterised protein [Vibrio cholerae]
MAQRFYSYPAGQRHPRTVWQNKFCRFTRISTAVEFAANLDQLLDFCLELSLPTEKHLRVYFCGWLF